MKTDGSIPDVPGALPLLGHTLKLRRQPLRFLASVPTDSDLVRFRVGSRFVVLVCDPELTRQVLCDDRTFDKGGLIIDRVRELVGDGLATCPHARHRHHRRLIQPTFHPSRLPGYVRTMNAGIGATILRWRDGQVLDVPVEMRRLAMNVAVESLFSGALSPGIVDQTVDDFTTVLSGFSRRVGRPILLNRLPTPGNRRYEQACTRMREAVGGAIADRRTSGVEHGDLLTALLMADHSTAGDTSDCGPALTDSEILDHATTFLAASTETTATVLGWTLHLLAEHPEIQDRLHTEIDTVLSGAPAGFEDLPKLELTRRIITESMRLYPSVWIMTRSVTTETILGGRLIPAGSVIAYSPYLIHHRGDLYDEPERFDPDRMNREPAQRHSFIPFGGGARKCIGSQYGINEMMLALAAIASRWRMEPARSTTVRPRAAVNLTARGLRLRATLRAPRGT
jgi:cytochrome P450